MCLVRRSWTWFDGFSEAELDLRQSLMALVRRSWTWFDGLSEAELDVV